MAQDLKQMERQARAQRLSVDTGRMADGLRRLLSEVFFEAIAPERFVDFLCAASSNLDRNGRPMKQTTLDRAGIYRFFTAADRAAMPEYRLNSLSDETFFAAVHRAFPAPPGAEQRRALLDGMDLSAFFKCCQFLDGESGFAMNAALRRCCPQLSGYTDEGWNALCREGIRIRNKYLGHVNNRTFEKMSVASWRRISQQWLSIARALEIPAVRGRLEELERIAQEADRQGNCRACTSEELARASGCYTAAQVEQILTGRYRYECAGGVLYCDPDEALSCLSEQDRLRRLEAELAAVQAGAARTEETGARQPERIPALGKTLAAYTGGVLNPRGVQELAESHRFVLDASVLESAEGRAFLGEQLCPALARAGRTTARALVVEATTFYHLMRQAVAYDDARRQRNALPASVAVADQRQALEEQMAALRPAKSGYLFARDRLGLSPLGVPDPLASGGEAILTFLTDRPLERLCVLTCGPTTLVRELEREAAPLAIIARVRAGAQQAVASIFSTFLPLIADAAAHPQLRQLTGTEEIAAPQPLRRKGPTARHGSEPFAPQLPLRELDETLLPHLFDPAPGLVLYTEEGQTLTLTGPLTEEGEEAEGGEGRLFVTDLPGQVAKLYNAEHLTAGRRDKLVEMLAHDPGLPEVCWPTHLLYTAQGVFAGYLMPRAAEGALPFSKSVLKIGSPSLRQRVFPRWTRRDLAKSARAAAALLAALHRRNILMGDVNAGNFMVDPQDSGAVQLVDTDSFQLGGFPCPVGFEEFTHPATARRLGIKGALRFGSFLRTESEEDYALAILIFEILFLGQNPFITKTSVGYLEAMAQKRFPYALIGDDFEVPEGDNWMIWKNLPRKLTEAFTAAFVRWEVPSAADWVRLLDSYLYSIEHYGFSDALAPEKYHEFNPEDPIYVDLECPLCHRAFNLHKNQLANLRRRGRPALCRSCNASIKLHGEEILPGALTCAICGKVYDERMETAAMVEAGVERPLCPDCRRPKVRCESCGEMFQIDRTQLEALREKGRPLRCPDCRTVVEVACAACGETFSLPRWQLLEKQRRGRDPLCSSCLAPEQATCAICGKSFSSIRWIVERNRAQGRSNLCPDCRPRR